MFLTHEQLVDMTGYKTKRKQRDWLAENGYSFDIRNDGRPNVLAEQIRERQVRNAAPARSTPNLDAIDRIG